jgi:hydrogenase maturation protease
MASSGETALILRVELPPALEESRRLALLEDDSGLPAHVTLIYPFADAEALVEPLRRKIETVLTGSPPLRLTLTGPARWPTVLYAAVEPTPSVLALQAKLSSAFPEYPLYGGMFAFEPHVTIATGPLSADERASLSAMASLPVEVSVGFVDLIEKTNGSWTTRWRFPLTPAVRVLVCGERLRGDDAAALIAVDMLPADARTLAEILEVGQLEIESVMDVPEGFSLIVVDAAVGVGPGDVVTMPLAEVAQPGAVGPWSTHAMPPDQVIALGGALRGSLPAGMFVGIGVAEFGLGEGLSPAVQSGLPAFVDALASAIRDLASPVP